MAGLPDRDGADADLRARLRRVHEAGACGVFLDGRVDVDVGEALLAVVLRQQGAIVNVVGDAQGPARGEPQAARGFSGRKVRQLDRGQEAALPLGHRDRDVEVARRGIESRLGPADLGFQESVRRVGPAEGEGEPREVLGLEKGEELRRPWVGQCRPQEVLRNRLAPGEPEDDLLSTRPAFRVKGDPPLPVLMRVRRGHRSPVIPVGFERQLSELGESAGSDLGREARIPERFRLLAKGCPRVLARPVDSDALAGVDVIEDRPAVRAPFGVQVDPSAEVATPDQLLADPLGVVLGHPVVVGLSGLSADLLAQFRFRHGRITEDLHLPSIPPGRVPVGGRPLAIDQVDAVVGLDCVRVVLFPQATEAHTEQGLEVQDPPLVLAVEAGRVGDGEAIAHPASDLEARLRVRFVGQEPLVARPDLEGERIADLSLEGGAQPRDESLGGHVATLVGSRIDGSPCEEQGGDVGLGQVGIVRGGEHGLEVVGPPFDVDLDAPATGAGFQAHVQLRRLEGVAVQVNPAGGDRGAAPSDLGGATRP